MFKNLLSQSIIPLMLTVGCVYPGGPFVTSISYNELPVSVAKAFSAQFPGPEQLQIFQSRFRERTQFYYFNFLQLGRHEKVRIRPTGEFESMLNEITLAELPDPVKSCFRKLYPDAIPTRLWKRSYEGRLNAFEIYLAGDQNAVEVKVVTISPEGVIMRW